MLGSRWRNVQAACTPRSKAGFTFLCSLATTLIKQRTTNPIALKQNKNLANLHTTTRHKKLTFTLAKPVTLFTSAIKGLPELQEKGASPLCFYILAPGKFIHTNVCKQVSSRGLFSCFFMLLAACEPVGAIRIICWKGAGNSCTSPLHTARASAPRPAHICLLREIKKS